MTRLSEELMDRLNRAKAFIFDMDGTLALGHDAAVGYRALPGAIELLEHLHQKAIPFCVFTNGTAKAPANYAASLREAGLSVGDDEMMTPATAAAIWFRQKDISRVRVLGGEGARQPLAAADIKTFGADEEVEGIQAVFTASSADLRFADLKLACRDIQDGAQLTTSSHVPFFASRSGRAMSVSFSANKALMGLTGCELEVLGKPSARSLFSALALMGLPETAVADTIVVGDDPALEIGLANNAGAVGILVTSGIYKGADQKNSGAQQPPAETLPDVSYLLDSLR